jgi:hypothetical protein
MLEALNFKNNTFIIWIEIAFPKATILAMLTICKESRREFVKSAFLLHIFLVLQIYFGAEAVEWTWQLDYGLDYRGKEFSSKQNQEIFSSLQRPDRSWNHNALHLIGAGVSFPWSKATGA